MTSNPNNPEYLERQCPLPYSGSRSGYIRHDKDCKPVADADPGVVVSQKVSGIEYRNFNTKYKRSVLKSGADHPVQPAILNGWNEDFIKQVWWDGSSYQKKVSGLSQKYVEQTLFKGWTLKDDGTQTEKIYKDYIAHDICNSELPAIFNLDGPVTIITPLGDMFLALEDDRDNTIINEERTLAILLEDNTTLYQIDYENDYLVREEGDLSLEYETGGLIEPA